MELTVEEETTLFQETFRYLGYHGDPTTLEIDEVTFEDYLSVKKECLTVVQPKKALKKIETLPFESKNLKAFLNGETESYFLAVTLGIRFDDWVNRLMLTHPAKAMIADAMGSALIEIFADQVQIKRFSPGYGDLDISTNRIIVDHLNATKQIGLYVSPSFSLIPRKSVVAIFGTKN